MPVTDADNRSSRRGDESGLRAERAGERQPPYRSGASEARSRDSDSFERRLRDSTRDNARFSDHADDEQFLDQRYADESQSDTRSAATRSLRQRQEGARREVQALQDLIQRQEGLARQSLEMRDGLVAVSDKLRRAGHEIGTVARRDIEDALIAPVRALCAEVRGLAEVRAVAEARELVESREGVSSRSIAQRLQDIRDRLDSFAGEARRAEPAPEMQRIEQRLERIDERIGGLKRSVDALAASDDAETFDAIRSELMRLEGRIDAGAVALASVAEAPPRKGHESAAGSAPGAARQESAGLPPAGGELAGVMAAIENGVAELRQRIDALGAQQRLDAEKTLQAAASAAAAAAEAAVSRLGQIAPVAETKDVAAIETPGDIRRSLAEIRAAQSHGSRQSEQGFEAMRRSLAELTQKLRGDQAPGPAGASGRDDARHRTEARVLVGPVTRSPATPPRAVPPPAFGARTSSIAVPPSAPASPLPQAGGAGEISTPDTTRDVTRDVSGAKPNVPETARSEPAGPAARDSASAQPELSGANQDKRQAATGAVEVAGAEVTPQPSAAKMVRIAPIERTRSVTVATASAVSVSVDAPADTSAEADVSGAPATLASADTTAVENPAALQASLSPDGGARAVVAPQAATPMSEPAPVAPQVAVPGGSDAADATAAARSLNVMSSFIAAARRARGLMGETPVEQGASGAVSPEPTAAREPAQLVQDEPATAPGIAPAVAEISTPVRAAAPASAAEVVRAPQPVSVLPGQRLDAAVAARGAQPELQRASVLRRVKRKWFGPRALFWASGLALAAAGTPLLVGLWHHVPGANGGARVAETAAQPVRRTAVTPLAAPKAPEQQAAAPAASSPSVTARVEAVLPGGALADNPSALYNVGDQLVEGKGAPGDLKLAATILERAAERGLAPAQYRLGRLFEKGLGVPRDLAKARSWYQRAAVQGNVKAMHNLAVLAADGTNAKPDYATAAVWFRRAAEFGLSDSQFNLAVLLTRGLGLPANPSEAYTWFAIAAARGDAEAGKRRDEVGSGLNASALAAAQTAAATWQPKAYDRSANEGAPGGAVSEPAAPSAATPTPTAPRASFAPSNFVKAQRTF